MTYMSLAYLSPKIGLCPIPFLVRHGSHGTTKVSTLAHVKAGRSSVGIPSVQRGLYSSDSTHPKTNMTTQTIMVGRLLFGKKNGLFSGDM